MSPSDLRAWVLVLMRDIVTPSVGLFLCVWLPLTHNFAPWQLPLLAGLVGVPLVARGTTPDVEKAPPAPPDQTVHPEPEGG